MTRQKFNRHLTRLHKWAGLVLGVQVFFWFASGFFMTLFPIDEVRGGHLAEQKPAVLESEDIIPIEIAMTLYEGDLYGAQVIMIADRPAYRLLGSAGDRLLMHALARWPYRPMRTMCARRRWPHIKGMASQKQL